jgi:hypothetical protein
VPLALGGYLRDAYEEAENFSRLLQQRVRGAGFFKTLLLRRLGSSMEAGRNTVMRLLGAAPDEVTDEDDDDSDDEEWQFDVGGEESPRLPRHSRIGLQGLHQSRGSFAEPLPGATTPGRQQRPQA